MMRWILMGVALLAVPLTACDDGAASTSSGDVDQGARTDGGQSGPCQAAADCEGGRICVESVCSECLADGECAEGPWGSGGVCLEGGCCQPGAEGCACGAGCGDGLTCESDRCVAEDAPCEAGTADCPCTAERPCADGALVCEAGLCLEPRDPMCDAEACAQQGRVCGVLGAGCAGCDAEAGYIDDGQGSCQTVTGEACEDDSTCDADTLCLGLLPNRGTNCVTPPACVDTAPGAGGQAQAWSAESGGCIPCPSCDGVAGSTGELWPTTTRAGACVCQTTEDHYFDVAAAVQGPRPCDADGDGWVQRPARQYLEGPDDTLRRNARCAPTVVRTVRLINERGEAREIDPVAELGTDQALTLYEPDTLDEQVRLETNEDIVPWGDALPQAAWLNPLTKLCVGANADFNANGLSDLEEYPNAMLNESNRWMAPFLKPSHFAELHTVSVDPADGGVLIIAERPRCDEGFPLDSVGPDRGEHWLECERRRAVSYATNRPGYDLAAFTCDADSGSCPGLTVADRAPAAPGDAPLGACGGPPTGRFTGMNHHSQFTCRRMVDGLSQGRSALATDAGTRFSASRCVPSEDGAVTCAHVAEPAVDAVLWTTTLVTRDFTDQYVEGCVPECDVLQPLCPGYDADPGLNTAGCGSLRTDFGKLYCNGCANTGDACDDADDIGECRNGRYLCDENDRSICVSNTQPVGPAEDIFGDGLDSSCDGFDYDEATSIFVNSDRGGGRGTPDRPFRSLGNVLRNVARDPESRVRIYIADDGRADGLLEESATLDVPPNVLAIVGGFENENCPDPDTFCVAAGYAEARIEVAAPIAMNVGSRTEPLVLRRLNITTTEVRARNGLSGDSKVALRIDNALKGTALPPGQNCGAMPEMAEGVLDGVPINHVILDHVTLTATDGTRGRPGRWQDVADPGEPGELGAPGCMIAAGFCGQACPDGYWLAGRGGNCACGGGAACGGGDGGLGGVSLGEACMLDATAEPEDAPEDGAPGEGAPGDVPQPARGGTANLLLCEQPVGAVQAGQAGVSGGEGEPGAAGGGFYSSTTGWTPRAGTNGTMGTNGGGGGGGAGGSGSGLGAGRCPRRGGHGGGGGAGGCGGLGGMGGGSGGASIGLLVVAGEVCLVDSTVGAGAGGAGAMAGPVQEGGLGGVGTGFGDAFVGHGAGEYQDDASDGAKGGDGGRGGRGGPGGAGVDGPSYAVLMADAEAVAGIDPPWAVVLGQAPIYTCGPDGGGAAAGCVTRAPLSDECELDSDCGNGRCRASVCPADPPEGAPACVPSQICQARLADGEACEVAADCRTSYCAADGACGALAARGEACPEGVHAACASGACVEEICVDGCVGRPDCDAIEDDNGALQSRYCRVLDAAVDHITGVCEVQLADGTFCPNGDEECASGVCSTGEPRCFSPCGDADDCGTDQWCNDNICEDQVGADSECTSDDECTSEACSFWVCLECNDDDDCEDGYCAGERCQAGLGLDVGCGRDGVCASGLCDLLAGCTSCQENNDCGAGQFCFAPIGQNECITPRADGEACEVDGMCTSNTCREGECRPACANDDACADTHFCEAGGCKLKLSNGVVCGGDNVCDSGICDVSCAPCIRGEGCESDQYCQVVAFGANSCRSKKSSGLACDLGAAEQCTDGACIDSRCRTACENDNDGACESDEFCHVGGCVSQLDNGAACVEDRVCDSGHCDLACVDCLNDGHCSGLQVCQIRFGDVNLCIDRKSAGSACGRDVECSSNWCDVDRCRNRLPRGSLCVEGRVCSSRVCSWGGCQ